MCSPVLLFDCERVCQGTNASLQQPDDFHRHCEELSAPQRELLLHHCSSPWHRILIMTLSVTEATLLLCWAARWEGLRAPSLALHCAFFIIYFYLFFCVPFPSSKCLVHCSQGAKRYHQDRSHMFIFNNLLWGSHTTLLRGLCGRIS